MHAGKGAGLTTAFGDFDLPVFFFFPFAHKKLTIWQGP